MRLNYDPQRNVLKAFVTPIGNIKVPNAREINPVLEQIILDRKRQDKGKQKSNMGGWHSDTDLIDWPEIARTDLVETLQSAVSNMVSIVAKCHKFNLQCNLIAWANVNRRGSHNSVHNHCNAHWSGVYYVKTGKYGENDIPRAGNIQFYDPRGAVNMMAHPGDCHDGESLSLVPAPGDLLLFPSWLYHSVNPFQSDVVRISIAFNARIDAFEDLTQVRARAG
jgi:uncharacterized protein (TIGR02466 family)